ncbi:MAG: glucosamine-6-phosphate deaminase [Candidatus Micrarchaeota archaeon]|nr:glucosamine-6-phosphate deaminase [Candidatus Micrarchaeota archaeon]
MSKLAARGRMINGMSVLVYEDSKALYSDAIRPLFGMLRNGNGHPTFGFATGGTFLPFYRAVVSEFGRNGDSFRKARAFNLDEYWRIDPKNPGSYAFYMHSNLYSHIDMGPGMAQLPRGNAEDPRAEARGYEGRIRKAGDVDLQYLGIGRNGHIGFNEPGTSFRSKTHLVKLSPRTREANSQYFSNGDMPRKALTMGINTILRSREIVLIATGEEKSAAVMKALQGPVSPRTPASALRLHSRATFMLDEEAASMLRR